MTTALIEELRRLRDTSNDKSDWEFLCAILAADEVSRAAEREASEMQNCSVCGAAWSACLMADDGRCPDCTLLWMHDHFSRRRAEAMMSGW